jgi:hypothetical protein
MGEREVSKVLEKIDDYEQSIHACLSLIHIYKWDEELKKVDPDVLHWIGKEFNPGELTPDVGLQLTDKRGLVVELKESLPQNGDNENDYWRDSFDQLKKYDSELEGWDTPSKKIENQELIFLTAQKFSRKVIDYINNNNLSFNDFSKNFAILEYNPANGLKEGVFIRLENGDIDDFKTITKQRLRDGMTVSLTYLFHSGLSSIKFLDYQPPAVYTMAILWDLIFSSMISEDDWRNAKTEGTRKMIEIEVTVDQLRNILSNNFADCNAKQGIREKWIEEALDNFVKIKLAKKRKDVVKGYTIKYRKKISADDSNKHRAFAELLYGGSGLQSTLEGFEDSKE